MASSSSRAPRQNKGRRKVAMVKMADSNNLQVTFSKRRFGLFKKASELCTLCGAEIAIIVFSPGNKVFPFGHPSAESVIERFLTGNPPQVSAAMSCFGAQCNPTLIRLNLELTQVHHELEQEKERGKLLNQKIKDSQAQNWYEAPINSLNLPQLEWLKFHMEELKKNVENQTEKLMMQSLNPPSQFFTGICPSGGIIPQNSNPPPQFFSGSCRSGGINLQSSNPPPQIFPGSCPSGGTYLPLEPNNIAASFNPNMMPAPGYNPGLGHPY